MTSNALEKLLQEQPFSIRQAEKDRVLLTILKELTAHHVANCPNYARIVSKITPEYEKGTSLADIPFLPITIFKYRRLRSIPDADVRTTVKSSGTTGSESHVELDSTSAKLTSRALSLIIGSVTSNLRLPLLIIDREEALSNKGGLGASASAILGLMPYGRDPCFALKTDMSLDHERVHAFLERHAGAKILIFGFTFKVWKYFVPYCEEHHVNLSKAMLLHSGGWKKLQSISVDNETFKARIKAATQIPSIKNFYGMAEMPGSIFLENDDGLLYPPHYADVIIRDPITFEPVPLGQKGLIHLLSALPRSFPGHSLLTEDMGVIESCDSGVNRHFGHGLRVFGRVPRAEIRGCSDVVNMGQVS